MNRIRVLFICVKNSARSQMAEAWLNEEYGDRFEAFSAGLTAGEMHPMAIKAMAEVDIDISQNQTTDVFDLVKTGELFSYVITVCDQLHSERCPVFVGVTERIHWSIFDPAEFEGSEQDTLDVFRSVRDEIFEAVDRWVQTV